MLTKYEQKDLKMIALILQKSTIRAARDAAESWLVKAGGNEGAKERRFEALVRLFGENGATLRQAPAKRP